MAFFPDLANAFKIAPAGVITQIIGAANKWRLMLRENEGAPDSAINFNDIGKTVDAFKTIGYLEKGPSTCP